MWLSSPLPRAGVTLEWSQPLQGLLKVGQVGWCECPGEGGAGCGVSEVGGGCLPWFLQVSGV